MALLPRLTVAEVALITVILSAVYFLSNAIYNVYFHPLAKFPGPMLAAASRLPRFFIVWTGDVERIKKLHDQYGDVVRIGPDNLSYCSAQASKDIYGFTPNKRQLPKDIKFYGFARGPQSGSVDMMEDGTVAHNIVNSIDDDVHARHRRLLSHAFSAQALKDQEPLINKYFDLLMTQLSKRADGSPLDIVQWMNSTTFDILGDLAFDDSFGALASASYHEYMSNMFKGLKMVGRVVMTASMFPVVQSALDCAIHYIPAINKARAKHAQFTVDKVKTRLQSNTARKDFMWFLTRHTDGRGMSQGEIVQNYIVLLVAGSETSATLLSGATWLLLRNPDALRKLAAETRAAFAVEEDICIATCQKLPYLKAVIEESLRWYPPAPGILPRRTDVNTVIDGRVVPPGTSVGVHIWSAHHSSRNFKDADRFVPERWLDDPRYADDNKEAFTPFSQGPRNCIGKSLAYAEMTSILARVVYRFDLELCPESENWIKGQAAWIVWEKPPLYIKLRER